MMINVFFSKAVDHGFISGVMVSVLVFERVDCGFIGGIMDANHYATDEATIYCFREKR
jgi:hypothetical protein